MLETLGEENKATPEAAPRHARKDTVKEWVGLGVLGVTSLVVAIDLFVMLLALPKLTEQLHATGTQLLWITDIYGFLLAGFLITMGTLGDHIGRKKVLLIGSALFAALSVLVAFSQSAEMLIFSRALLGVAGAMIAPAALSLMRFMFPDPKENALAISIWLSCLVGGTILGPLVGGILLEHFWWGSVFLVGVPPIVIGCLLGIKLLPEYKNPEPGRFHLLSVFLSLAAILPLIYGIKEIAVNGFELLPLAGIAAGIIFGLVFVQQQLRLRDPLLDMRLFKKPAFTIMLVSMLCNTMFPGAVMVLSTQYLQLVAGQSPLEAGLWMIPAMAGSFIGFMGAPHLGRFFRPAYLMGLGLVCSVGGLLVLCLTSVGGSLAPLIVGFFLFNLGSGPLVTLGTGIVIGAVAPPKAGAAAAVSETSNEFGFALGVAVVGSVGAFVYRAQTASLPAGLSPEATRAVHETLATAVDTARNVPGQLGQDILYFARNAFVQEYHTVALLSAAVMTVVAVVIVTKLKNVKAGGEHAG